MEAMHFMQFTPGSPGTAWSCFRIALLQLVHAATRAGIERSEALIGNCMVGYILPNIYVFVNHV